MRSNEVRNFLALISFFPIDSHADPICSPINTCQVKKIVWAKSRWKTLLDKEFKFEKFCDADRPQSNFENNLGLELWLFKGDSEKAGSFQAQPYITVNLHTYKLTYVIASASVPAQANAVAFTHRLKPNGKELVTVNCEKR